MCSLTEWIQVICAFLTFILAIIIYCQNSKIKTLTNVVDSLNKQVNIAQDLLSFEIKSRLNSVQPNFVVRKIFSNTDKSLTLNLINQGTMAKNIEFKSISNILSLKKADEKNLSIDKNYKIQVIINVNNVEEKFDFKMCFEDENSNLFDQIITVIDGKPCITISKNI